MRQTKAWTEEEERVMLDRYTADGSAILAEEMGRTKSSVQKKAFNMGLRAKGVTNSEDRQLRALHTKLREKARNQDPEVIKRRRDILRRNNLNRRARFRAQRICVSCGKPSLENSASHCLLHWAILIGEGCGHRDKAFGQMLLRKLEDQNYRCAMTGELLVPGLNASLDHIVPKCKGGSMDDPDNLWWVTLDVNFAKRQFMPDEFLEFCRKVVAFAQGKEA